MPGFRRTLPNALTLARVALAVALFAILARYRFSPAQPSPGPARVDAALLLAIGLFVLAAITDALDGHLARRWNTVSVFGRIIDPFADKLLVIGAFVMLAGPGFSDGVRPVSGVYPWMAVVVLARELLITSIRGVLEGQGVDFSATLSGKLKMILQSVSIPMAMLLVALMPVAGDRASLVPIVNFWVMVVTVAVTAASGAPYVRRALLWAAAKDQP